MERQVNYTPSSIGHDYSDFKDNANPYPYAYATP